MKYGFHLLVPHPCQSIGIHVISITSSGPGRVEQIMREDGPHWKIYRPRCRETGGRQWRPCQDGSTVVRDHAEGDRHWLCADRIRADRKGQGQTAWKWRNGHHAMSRDEWRSLRGLSFLSLITVGEVKPNSPMFCLWRNMFANGRPSQVCETRTAVKCFLSFLLIIHLVKIDVLELKLFHKTREVISIMRMSWGNLSLDHSHLNHQICISFRKWKCFAWLLNRV